MNFAQYNNLNLSNDPKWEKDQKNVPPINAIRTKIPLFATRTLDQTQIIKLPTPMAFLFSTLSRERHNLNS